MAARKPAKLSAPATVTAIQLAQNGTSTPFKVTGPPHHNPDQLQKCDQGKDGGGKRAKGSCGHCPSPMAHENVLVPASKMGGTGASATRLEQGSSGDNLRLERPKPFQEELCSLNQISQSTEFKALRKPPNALSRQGSVLLVAFERSEMAVRLISVGFGFDLGRAAVATFFDLGSSRWRLITLGGSEEPILMPSDGEMRSSTGAGCAGVSLLAAVISSRSAFANAPCEIGNAYGLSRQGAGRPLLHYAVEF